MSKETNKKNHPRSENLPDLPDFASAAQQEISFADLQPLFDAQSRRLDDLLCCPEARPASLNTRHSRTFRTRMFYAWGILAIYCVAAAIYWGISLWHYQYDIYFRIYTLFLEGCFLFLAVDTVSTTLAILRHDPASTPFDRMLRYSSFSILNLKRTATIGIAASFTLILVSCTPTVGDGHTLTQNHPARIEAVESVTNIVNNI